MPERRFAWFASAALLLAVALVLGGVATAGFTWLDDGLYVTNNLHVLGGLTGDGLAWALGAGDGRDTYFHPLTWLSLMADVQLFGPNPVALHLENLALHGAAAVLVLLLALRTTGRRWPALAAALLFALHPLVVEPVTWIVERKTVLATVLGLGAVHAWVGHLLRPARWRVALAAALLLLSLLAKPHLVVLPALLLVLDLWPLGRLAPLAGPGGRFAPAPLGALVLEKWPLALVSAAGAALVLRALPATTTTGEPPPPLGLRLEQAVASLADYAGAVLWPRRLTMLREYPSVVAPGALLAGAAVLVLVSAGALRLARRRPWLLAGWCWFLVALAPSLGLVQSGLWPAWADRFTYAALVGPSLAVAFEGAALAARGPAARAGVLAAAAAALLALGITARAQVEHWHSPVALLGRAAEQSPGSALLRTMHAATLLNEGRLDEARGALLKALQLDPALQQAHLRLAEVDHRSGQVDAAAREYREALRLAPDDATAHFGLGFLAWEQGWSDVARFHLARFLQVASPDARGLERWARAWLAGVEAAPAGTPRPSPPPGSGLQ